MSFRLLCTISGHGFGHLSQVAPLLHELAKRRPDLEMRVVTTLPHALLVRSLPDGFSWECRSQDVGLVQADPMQVDRHGTAMALRSLHGAWQQRLDAEKQAMAAWQPDLLVADIPYLPIAAAADLGIPTLAIASLSWDAVLAAYFSRTDPEVASWWHDMRQAYACTTLALLPHPAIVAENPFPNTLCINPLTTLGQRRTAQLRQTLALSEEDKRALILVTMGGIPSHTLPIAALAQEKRFHWLIDIPTAADYPEHLHGLDQRLSRWSFADVAASVDGIVSKPGYGMAIAAMAQQIPFLYLRRGLFPDETVICPWLDREGRCAELSAAAFYSGNWYRSLRQQLDRPIPPPPLVNGAQQGAACIVERFMSHNGRNDDHSHPKKGRF